MTAAPSLTWLYLKLYPGRLELLDDTVRVVAAPLAAAAADHASRWFFLRYVDAAGPHIRLRLLTPLDAADEVAAALPDQLTALRGLTGRPAARPAAPPLTLPGTPAAPEEAAPPEARLDVYEPEYAKWGEPRYMAAVEDAFQRSSELAVRLLAEMDGGLATRLAVGRCLFGGLLAALPVSDAARERFLASHFEWWTGGARSGVGPARREAAAAASREMEPEVTARVREIASSPVVGAAPGVFAASVTEMLPLADPARKPLFLAFHLLHLMLNRLGVTPDEEAVLSLLSRAAWVGE